MRATGAEAKAFYSDPEFWPDGAEESSDTDPKVNGKVISLYELDVMALADDDILDYKDSYVSLPGKDSPVKLDTLFRNWKRKQSTVTLLVAVDKQDLEKVKGAIHFAGGKIL